QRDQFTAWAADQDSRFKAAVERETGRPLTPEDQDRALLFLTETLNIAPQQLRQLWAGSPLLRSVEAQKLIFMGARDAEREERLKHNRPVAPPRPQRPGNSSASYGGRDPLSDAASRNDMESYIKLRGNK